ncbi:anti-sigma factor family protein [Rhizobium sp.]
MIDDETLLLLNAYLDGELSPPEALAMERRLASEPELRAHYESLFRLSARLKPALAGHSVPEEQMRSRIVAHIGLSEHAPSRQSERRHRFWPAMAATLVIGAGLGYVAGSSYAPVGVESAGIPDIALSAHLRALAAQQPFDIASSDRHVVRPWFNGRTTLAPKAPDLSAEGFPLVGGRIDVVAQETVPTLVYNRRRHVISVTALPLDGFSPGEDIRGGVNILRWTAGNLAYVAVSDLNIAELRTFSELFTRTP